MLPATTCGVLLGQPTLRVCVRTRVRGAVRCVVAVYLHTLLWGVSGIVLVTCDSARRWHFALFKIDKKFARAPLTRIVDFFRSELLKTVHDACIAVPDNAGRAPPFAFFLFLCT